MTAKEKELLAKDLSGRLPYGVKFTLVGNERNIYYVIGINLGVTDDGELEYFVTAFDISSVEISGVKPYLRPMSSMTKKEKEEFRTLISPEASCAYEDCLEWDAQIIGGGYLQISVEDFSKVVDWLNVCHFDYRGLIPMGLALEAPENMYEF